MPSLSPGELLIVAREVTAFQKPSSRDYESVRTWLSEKRPITEKEAEIFKKKEDLVTLHRGREWAKFDGFFVNAMLHFPFMQVRWVCIGGGHEGADLVEEMA